MFKTNSVVKQSTPNEHTKISNKTHQPLSKNLDSKSLDVDKTSDNRNTNIQLTNISMSIMEDLKSFSKEWVEIIEKKHDDINKDLHNFLKFSGILVIN
jgi:hypothetical protein